MGAASYVVGPPALVAYTTLVVVIVALYFLFNGFGESFDVGYYLLATSPYMWASYGVGLAIAFSLIGAATGIFLTGASVLGAGVRAPRITTRNLVSVIFCEAVAIYGIIVSIVFASKMTVTSDFSADAYFTGYALFWSGITVGLCNLACGLTVGITGASTALADAHDGQLFVKVLVIGIFGSVIGIFGLIVGLLQSGKASAFTESK